MQAYLVAGLAKVGVRQPKDLDGGRKKAGKRCVVQPISDNRVDIRSDGQRDGAEIFRTKVLASVTPAQLGEQGRRAFAAEESQMDNAVACPLRVSVCSACAGSVCVSRLARAVPRARFHTDGRFVTRSMMDSVTVQSPVSMKAFVMTVAIMVSMSSVRRNRCAEKNAFCPVSSRSASVSQRKSRAIAPTPMAPV